MKKKRFCGMNLLSITKKNRNIFCTLLLIANEVKSTGYPFENDDLQDLLDNIDKSRVQFWIN